MLPGHLLKIIQHSGTAIQTNQLHHHCMAVTKKQSGNAIIYCENQMQSTLRRHTVTQPDSYQRHCSNILTTVSTKTIYALKFQLATTSTSELPYKIQPPHDHYKYYSKPLHQ